MYTKGASLNRIAGIVMSKLLTVKKHHQLEWVGVHEDTGLWRYNILLKPAAAKRQMGRDPIVVVHNRFFKLKKVRPLKRAKPEGPRRWFRIGCELIATI